MRGRTDGTSRVYRICSKLIAKGMLALALGATFPTSIVAQTGRDDYVYLKQSVFAIPIQVAPDRVNDIKELRLFVSADRGRTWRMMQTARPTQKMFTFQAPGDGEYWFTLAYVDKSDNVEPSDVRDEPPGLKVILDTRAPVIDLQAMPRTDAQASVAWRVTDDQIDLSSLKLEYQETGESNWSELRVSPAASGKRDWICDANRSYTVRATVKDRSGNASVAKVEIPRASASIPTASRPSNPESSPPSRGFDVPPPPAMRPMSNPAPESNTDLATRAPIDSGWTAQKPAMNSAMNPVAPTPPPLATNVPATAAAPTAAAMPAPAVARPNVFDRSRPDLPADMPKSTTSPASQANTTPANSSGQAEDRNQFLAITNKAPIASSAKPPVRETAKDSGIVQASATEAPKPPTRKIPLVNSTRFAVNYDVKGVGPAGIGKVELFYTDDNGQTWKSAGEDPKKSPPFEVELPKEGRYGLKVVVTSPAGFGQKPPVKGEAPAMVVEVDTTPPVAELFQPVPDNNGLNDTMVIAWTAKDAHIASNPVSLYFAEFAEGPWYAIKTNLPASGQYSWKVPEGLPHQVYMRLIARDLCDNVSMADTPKPVLIDLSRPSAEITDIAILPEKSGIR